MRIFPLLAVALTLPATATATARPVVVELFQSQGCSSCPPANRNLGVLAARHPDTLPLNFAVTYWDRLGWKDSFAKPAFTARQWDYAHANARAQVATPQTVVNGTRFINGGNGRELLATIADAARDPAGPAIAAVGGGATIAAGHAAKPAVVWLVRYDPRTIQVSIRAGENGGKTLPHSNIVRALDQIGIWNGAAKHFTIPASADPAWRTAVLVQDGTGGRIVAAARL